MTEAIPETEPCAVAPLATPVTVTVSVVQEPSDAPPGTLSRACTSVFAPRVPSLQVWVPSPPPQTVKAGAGKLLGLAEICTITSSTVPPVGLTSMVYSTGCPGRTVLVVACTVTQSCVAAEDDDALPPDMEPGLMLGVGLGGGELGPAGSVWHTLFAYAGVECAPARAAATVPTPSTAKPAIVLSTVDPARLLRRRTPGWDLSCGVSSRLGIMGYLTGCSR